MPVRSRLRVPNKMQVLDFQTLAFFLFPFCTTLAPPKGLFWGKIYVFLKIFSEVSLSFVRSEAKLVKVGVNRKNVKTQHEDISLLILLSGSLLILLFSIIQTNLRLFSHTYNIF